MCVCEGQEVRATLTVTWLWDFSGNCSKDVTNCFDSKVAFASFHIKIVNVMQAKLMWAWSLIHISSWIPQKGEPNASLCFSKIEIMAAFTSCFMICKIRK